MTKREDIYGLDTNILMSPKVWEVSGHTASFTDATLDCKNCGERTRADHLIEDNITRRNLGLIGFCVKIKIHKSLPLMIFASREALKSSGFCE